MFPQSTILDPIFWMLLGAAQLFIIQSANVWADEYDLHMNWWKWSLVISWWFSFLLTINASFVLLGEHEGNAGWYLLGFAGTTLIISGVAIFNLILRLRNKIKKSQNS
ncbi:hypothetical protein L0B53_00475 [Vibrio sp. SS-MA-C1-2]|uniref:hypothetical protein n=1 Tax=Vibrio sp. SS-MA-C1-2 TaxID=2908646 RepID=UPI001F3F74D8|nr:hypothetical protein [Vibrio sp. SS-MA-C1-2]UJF17287.1 hypothetical protein L0B53_00475 [Vibrio sp. SS-MA-C1-2]